MHDLAAVCEQSFAVVLDRHGHATPTEAAAELVGHYMAIRFDAIRLYDDVVDGLAAVRKHVPVGLLTNGNTDPDRCGLRGAFDAVVMGPDHGLEKPDPGAFGLVSDRLGVEPADLAHVVDDADDVDGINAVGGVSVLIERDGVRPDLRARADRVIAHLGELPPLLGLVT